MKDWLSEPDVSIMGVCVCVCFANLIIHRSTYSEPSMAEKRSKLIAFNYKNFHADYFFLQWV